MQTKDGANVRIPPPFLPLLTVLVGVGLNFIWPLAVGASLPVWIRIVLGAILVAAGFGLAVGAMKRFIATGQRPEPWETTPEIVESGPFRFTRNPMYVGMVLFCVAIGVMLANGWILILSPLCALGIQYVAIRHEEAYLEQKFGEQYLAYKRNVRRWL
jgi:protein-S-isoprenylcysteine O-methyltransferase Ste14